MKAWELLEPEGVWIKKEFAQTENGRSVSANSDKACKFCALGAIKKIYTDTDSDSFCIAYGKLSNYVESVGRADIPSWNDAYETTHEEVIRVLKELDI